MATAYVLINCELGSEEAIIGQLKGLEGVKEVHGTFGAYDILAKIESDTVEKLRETITWKMEEHTSELQSHHDLVCRLLLEKKKKNKKNK